MKIAALPCRTLLASLALASQSVFLVGCGTCPEGGNPKLRPVIIVNPSGIQPRILAETEQPTLIIDLPPPDELTKAGNTPSGFGVPEPDAAKDTDHPGTRPIVLINVAPENMPTTNHPGTRPIVLRTGPADPLSPTSLKGAARRTIVVELPRCFPAYGNGKPVRVRYRNGKPYVVPPGEVLLGMEPPIIVRHPGTRP